MSKVVTNAQYRKSRGTDQPFRNSEEQVQAIWAEQIRREKRIPAKAAPTVKSPSEGGPVKS